MKRLLPVAALGLALAASLAATPAADGTDSPSTEVTAQGSPAPCAPPAVPTGLASAVNGSSIGLSWTPLAATGPAPTEYRVDVGSAPGATDLKFLASATATQYQTTLPPGTYYARKKAVSSCSESPATDEVVFTISSAPLVEW